MSKKKTYGCQKRRPIGVKKEDLSVKKVHFNTFLSFPVLLHTGYNYITHDMSLAHLERARAAHVQNETLERDIASEFSRPGVDGTHKRRLAQSHRVRGMLDRMRANGKKLKRYYADEDGSRKEEVERTGGRNNNNNNNKGGGGNKNTNEDGENAVFETFYGALKELKKKKKDDDDHKRKRFVSEEEETLSSAAALREKLEEAQKFEAQKERLKKKLSKKSNNGTKEQQEVAENDARLDPNSERLPDGVDFSGEEHQGRYLDLVRFHHAFVADVARTFGVSFTDEVKKNAAKKRKMEHHQQQQQQQQQQKATKTQKSEEKEEDKKDDEDDDDDDEETKRKPLEYVAFLHELPNLFDGEKTTNLDRSKKFSKTYVSFCEELYEYLVDFLERASPLQFARDVLVPEEIDEEFEKIFEKGELKGWEDKGVVTSTRNNNNNTLDLSVVKDIAKGKNASSSKALKSNMKDEEIKDALSKAGLKTGGTPDERCERLFQVAKLVSAAKGNDATIPSKYIRKGVVVGGGSGADGKKDEEERRLKTQIERAKHIARLEYRLKILFAGALRKTLDNTKSQAEKKLTMSREEIEREHEEDDDFAFSDVDEDEDEMNKEIYNPLKLPMGWDGKPIPYWLYKLHGLNIEFKCEICGNYSYWGRRAYEQHFTQWRHQHGMRCLNIPFSKAFNEVTTIEEARRLHQTLEEKKLGKWDRQHDQECEDADGNVYNAKTFAELRSQGLI